MGVGLCTLFSNIFERVPRTRFIFENILENIDAPDGFSLKNKRAFRSP